MLSRLSRRSLSLEARRCQAPQPNFSHDQPPTGPEKRSKCPSHCEQANFYDSIFLKTHFGTLTFKNEHGLKLEAETRYVKQGGKADWWLSNRSKVPEFHVPETSRKLTFTDNEFAFKSKSTTELFRSSLLFWLFSKDALVDNNMAIMNATKKVLGENIFNKIMKATVYGQFVAGEDKEAIKPTIARLTNSGIGSILDYAVEEDLDQEEAEKLEMDGCASDDKLSDDIPLQSLASEKFQAHQDFGDRRRGVVSARTYFYKDEANCDKYMEHFLYCINAAGGASEDGFAAIKLTALGRPQFLLQFSEALVSSRMLFETLAGVGKTENLDKSILEHGFDEHRFMDKAGRMGLSISRKGMQETFRFMQRSADGSGYIDLLDWNNLLSSNSRISDIFITTNENGEEVRLMKELTDDEEAQMNRMLQRINTLAEAAEAQGVRLMIDAEQTYFQPAISRMAVEMMRKFNHTRPVIFNTYQCYLKQSFNNFIIDLEQARREGFHFGAKIVRGAYMEQERQRASELGYEDPIQPDYEATSRCYHRTLDVGLEYIHSHGDANIMIASHNIDSIKYAISRMDTLDISRDCGKVFFGQLLGMCDQVTFPLGQAGYPAYKYVPFGPVDDVLPYLSRRCQENRSLLEGVKAERAIVKQELFRRLKRFNRY